MYTASKISIFFYIVGATLSLIGMFMYAFIPNIGIMLLSAMVVSYIFAIITHLFVKAKHRGGR